jgi:hypothetical protein
VHEREFIRDAVHGAIGGVVATAVMSLAASALYRLERQGRIFRSMPTSEVWLRTSSTPLRLKVSSRFSMRWPDD